MGEDKGKEDALRVLAIDPGNEQSAWVEWDGQTIRNHGKGPNADVLEVIPACNPDVLAVEEICSFGMPVGREVFHTCIWTGRFLQVAEYYNIPHELIPRREVKLYLCNSLRAKDSNVRQALIDKVGSQGKKACPGPTYGIKADEWQALGLAVTALQQELEGAF